jgi:hypothetical protein
MVEPIHDETFGPLEWDPLLDCWLGGIDWPPGLHTEVAIWLPDGDSPAGLRQAREGLPEAGRPARAWPGSGRMRSTPAAASPARC